VRAPPPHLDRFVTGSRITIHSFTSPNLQKYSFSPSGERKNLQKYSFSPSGERKKQQNTMRLFHSDTNRVWCTLNKKLAASSASVSALHLNNSAHYKALVSILIKMSQVKLGIWITTQVYTQCACPRRDFPLFPSTSVLPR